MMKVILINPPISPEERCGSVVKEGAGRQAPLGICYIAAVLKKNKIPVKIIDAEAENLEYSEIIDRLKKLGATTIGITSTTVAFHRALNLAQEIKKSDDSSFIFIGGPHVCAIPESTMEFDCFDVGIIGEGEYTVLELMQALSSSKGKPIDYFKIPGLIFRKDGKIVRSDPRKLIQDLDELPYPARELLPGVDYYNPAPMNYLKKPVLSMITSRGCPNQCTFCDHGVFGYKFRCHSAKRVVDEIKMLINDYGARELSIVDDTFGVDKKRVLEICRLMKKNNINLHWNAMISENTTTKEMLRAMKDAGCGYLEIGIETGSPRVLKDIRKGTTLERIGGLVKYADNLGFRVKGFFMIGHPTDTIQSIEQTIAFAKSIPLTDIVVKIFTPYPNTPAYNQAKEHGRFIHEQDWTKFSNFEVIYLPGDFTEEELRYYWKKMYRKFYFRPSIVWRHMKQLKNWTAIKRYARGFKVVMKFLF